VSKIKIDGDTSGIKKSLLDLSKDIKDLGKSKVAIFDKEQKDFLTKDAKTAMDGLKKQMEQNREEISKAIREQKKQVQTIENEVKSRQKINDLLKKQVELQKEASRIESVQGAVKGPGRGGMMGRVGGMLGRLNPMALAGGALLGAGAFAVGRGRQAFGRYEGGIQDRIALRGRGVGDMDLADPRRAARAGMDAQMVRRARLGSMDTFGRAGATQQAVIQRAEFERNFGIQSGTLQNMGTQLRGNLGGAEAQKQLMTIQAGLLASGITDEIGPYLETSANMLQELTEGGLTFSDTAMAALGGLIARGMSAERAGKLISGVDRSIRSGTGEQGAFFRDVLANAGIAEGNQTVGTLDFMRQAGGLFGFQTEGQGFGARTQQAMRGLGGGQRTGQAVAGSMLNMFDRFGNAQEIQTLLNSSNIEDQRRGQRMEVGRLQGIQSVFGFSDPRDAARVETLMTELQKGDKTEKQVRDEIDKMQKGETELGNLKLISKSNEGIYDETKKFNATMQDVFGSQLAPVFTTLEQTMGSVDSTMKALLEYFGVESPTAAVEDAIAGKGSLTQSEFDQATMGDPAKQKAFSEQMAKAMVKDQDRLEELRAKKNLTGAERFEMGRLTSTQKNRDRMSMSITGLSPDAQMGKEDKLRFAKLTEERLKEEKMALDSSPMAAISKLVDGISNFFSGDKPAQKSTEELKVLQDIANANKQAVNETKRQTSAVKLSNGAKASTVKNY
jgi:hypothetical protein